MVAFAATVLTAYRDGGFRFTIGDVTVNADGRRGVVSLSDWGAVRRLEAAGVLARRVWRGSGLDGHDVFSVTPAVWATLARPAA
jgi:hypothetical protein